MASILREKLDELLKDWKQLRDNQREVLERPIPDLTDYFSEEDAKRAREQQERVRRDFRIRANNYDRLISQLEMAIQEAEFKIQGLRKAEPLLIDAKDIKKVSGLNQYIAMRQESGLGWDVTNMEWKDACTFAEYVPWLVGMLGKVLDEVVRLQGVIEQQ